MSEQSPEREDSEAGTYLDLQREVDGNFDGSWENFLKAVLNPAEILYFVLWRHCDGQAHKIETWAKDKKLPPDWLPRFYGLLTHEGQFRPDAETSAPKPPEGAVDQKSGTAPVPMLDIRGDGKKPSGDN